MSWPRRFFALSFVGLGVKTRVRATTVTGSPNNQRMYLVAGRGVLIVCDTGEHDCGSVVPLDQNSSLGAPVEAGNRVFVPDYGTGQVWIVDLANRSVIAKPQVLSPRTQFQLINRDGVVFYNDTGSERAGVIELDGRVTPIAKFDPKEPAKGLNVSVPGTPLPPTDPSTPGPGPTEPTAPTAPTVPKNGKVNGPGIACPPTCTTTVNKGQSLTLTAQPAAGFTFGGWGGACSGTATCKVTMDADKTVSARFTASGTTPFAGSWVNVNSGTGDIIRTRITVVSPTTATLNLSGSCSPSACDWGNTTATLVGGQLQAFYDQGFAIRTVRITQPGGQLTIRIQHDYVPPDTRADRDSTDVMRKN